jgi:SAM-dependent methyltransferase
MTAPELFGRLAARYEEHFSVPHRRAYDDLAWELTSRFLPPPPGQVVDVGCGVGRWARRFTGLGYEVTGIEPAPEMAARAGLVPGLMVVPCGVEDAQLAAGCAGAVVAMGSIQYAADPVGAIARMAGWLRPGGVLAVLVDSRIALGVELLRAGRDAEAAERLSTGRGVWQAAGVSAGLQLFDRASLVSAVDAAGLDVLAVHGLLVGASVWGRDDLAARLAADYTGQLAAERSLALQPDLADLGKQLLVLARRASWVESGSQTR